MATRGVAVVFFAAGVSAADFALVNDGSQRLLAILNRATGQNSQNSLLSLYKFNGAGKPNLISTMRTDADHWLPQVRGVPIVAVSGLRGEGIDRLMTAIQEAYAVWNKRVPTATLNRWFEQAVDANPPPAVSGRRLKLNYITQAKARPPSFILFCSRADAVPTSYLRYLTNSMREAFDLPGTPVRITLREKQNPFAHKRKRLS